MTRRRVIVLGLEGYDPAYGESLMEEGALPNLKLLRDSGMRFSSTMAPTARSACRGSNSRPASPRPTAAASRRCASIPRPMK